MQYTRIIPARPHSHCRISDCYLYESWPELVEYSIKNGRYDADWGFNGFVGRRFSGWEDVLGTLYRPWPEGVQVVDRMLAALEGIELPKPQDRKRRPRFSDDSGDELDFDRLRSGQDFWRTSRREAATGPVAITVMSDLCTAGSVSAADILWRGAAGIALINILEAAGYLAEFWAFDPCTANHENPDTLYRDWGMFNAVRLKAAGDPVDIGTLATAISGWAYRTIWFRAISIGSQPYNIGGTRAAYPEEIELMSDDPKKIVVSDIWTLEAAVERIEKAIHDIDPLCQEEFAECPQ